MTTTQSEIGDLIAQMTLTEKAGQLPSISISAYQNRTAPSLLCTSDRDKQPLEVESALGQGGVGSLLFVTDPRRSTVCSGWPSKVTGSASLRCSALT